MIVKFEIDYGHNSSRVFATECQSFEIYSEEEGGIYNHILSVDEIKIDEADTIKYEILCADIKKSWVKRSRVTV